MSYSNGSKLYSLLLGAAVLLSACGGEQTPVPVAPVPVPAPAPAPGAPGYPYPAGNCSNVFATSMTDFIAQMQGCYGNINLPVQVIVYDFAGQTPDVIIPAGQYAWQDIYSRVLPVMSVAYDGSWGITPNSVRVNFMGNQGMLVSFSQVLTYMGFSGWGYYNNYNSYPGYGIYGSAWVPHTHNGRKGFNIGIGFSGSF